MIGVIWLDDMWVILMRGWMAEEAAAVIAVGVQLDKVGGAVDDRRLCHSSFIALARKAEKLLPQMIE